RLPPSFPTRRSSDLVVVGDLPDALTRGARDDHEGQEVLLARMAGPRGGGVIPVGETAVTFRWGAGEGLAEPAVECVGGGAGAGLHEAAHVVVAHPAAHDEDALIPQDRKSTRL